jgi:hypothetical protein
MIQSKDSIRLLNQISLHCEKAGHTYLDEYKLITEQKSTLSSRQRAFLCYFVEKEIDKVKSKEDER